METKATNEVGYATPYSDNSFAMVPNGWTMFLRTCILHQLVRFFVLALKIMRIVVGGHS